MLTGRDASTSSTLIAMGRWAQGLWAAFARFWTATAAIWAGVVPWIAMCSAIESA